MACWPVCATGRPVGGLRHRTGPFGWSAHGTVFGGRLPWPHPSSAGRQVVSLQAVAA